MQWRRSRYLARTALTASLLALAPLMSGHKSTYLAAHTRSGLERKPSSRYRERKRYELHLETSLGDRIADEVTPTELTLLYDRLSADGLAPGSIRRINSLLRAAYNWGNRRGLAAENPASLAETPAVIAAPPNAPSMATVCAHLVVLRDKDPLLALVVRLAATLGLRRSELVALRWRDIDLEAGAVRVAYGVTVTPGYGMRLADTKTGQLGPGVLWLDEEALEELRIEREKLDERMAKVSSLEFEEAFVLSFDPLGAAPANPDTLSGRLRKHCTRHPELPRLRLKDLRCFTATELVADGTDITTAQAVLRHGHSQTTRQYYIAANARRARTATIDLGARLSETLNRRAG
jgi:integrase